LFYIGGPMALRGEITIGEMVAFISLLAYLAIPLRSMSFLLAMYKQAQAALERIDEIYSPAPDRPDLPKPHSVPQAPPSFALRNLSFCYPSTPDLHALKDINLEIPAGSTLGIFGPTGAGKTTLLHCLIRLYNPPRETVFVNETDVCALNLDQWRRHVSLVPQKAFLFSDSLEDNILLHHDDNGRLPALLQLTTLDIDVKTFTDGLHSQVGEAGIMLSGGQRQRVALARGLYRPHCVLMLDDVLSAVDHRTEKELIASLRNASNHPTTFIVSHRISAIAHADQIAVLEKGRLSALGSHAQLMAQDGIYRETWKRQSELEVS
jgi:ATP-binding cassette subfamily B multidrug efflux pump